MSDCIRGILPLRILPLPVRRGRAGEGVLHCGRVAYKAIPLAPDPLPNPPPAYREREQEATPRHV
jgi:hypothetical protein